jgi:drug/metabolite transporter (DMT)-like permease
MIDALPAAPVVVLGLLAAATWGAADFGGGLASRRAPLLGVTLFVQAIGIVLAAGFWVLGGEPLPSAADIGWAVVAGIFGAAGISGLYGALAAGPMSVVAPIVGVLGASVPVVVGFALEGMPPPIVLVGIGLALVSVVLVSGAASSPATGSGGLPLALLAGTGIGLFSVAISQVSEGVVFGPLIVVRTVASAIFIAIIVVGRRQWRLPRPTWRLVTAVAITDLLGNGAYVGATQVGALAVATSLGSLYPVATVLLAALVLRERITRRHGIGILAAGAAIAAIAGGSA